MKKRNIIICILSAVTLIIVSIALSMTVFAKKRGGGSIVINDNRTIALNAYDISIEVGETETLTAKLSVGKGKFVWASSDESVATVTGKGEVTGLKTGVTTVSAECNGKKAECKVTVVLPDGYPGFSKGDEVIEVFVGKTYTIDTEVTFNGEKVEADLSYEVSDESVATVADGVVTGVKEGSASINVSAEYGGFAILKTVTVKVYGKMMIEASEENISLQLVSDNALNYRSSVYFGVKAYFDLNDVTEFVTDVEWVSDDDKTVTVTASADKDGAKRALVSSVKAGKTKIKCNFRYNEESYAYSFDVTAEKSVYSASEAVLSDSVNDGNQTATLATNLSENCVITEALKATVGGNLLKVRGTENGNVILDRPTELEKGETAIILEDEKWVCTFDGGVYCTAVLTNDSCEELQNGGEISAGSYYVLGEDINVGWTSKTMDPIKVYGVLDGKGHTLKGITLDKPDTGWLKDPQDPSQTYVSYITSNSGVIKNIAVEYETTADTHNGSLTFSNIVQINEGEINNVFLTAHVKGNAWYGSVFVGKNYGVIRNCVTVAPTYSTSNQGLANRCSAYVAFSYGGSIINCYTLGEKWDGMNDSSAKGAGKCYSEAYTGGITLKNWRGSTDMAEILSSDDFSAANGWSDYWTTDKYSVSFSGKEISLIPTTYLDLDFIEESDGNIAISVPEEITTLTGATITFNDKKVTPVSLENGILTVKRGAFDYGEYNIKIAYAEKTYKALNVSFVTKAIRASDAADFYKLFTGDEDAYYVLTEDIDFGGKALVGNITLKGTFEGKGHTLKNFVLDYSAGGPGAADNGWMCFLFAENKVTIRNVSFEYAMKDAPNDRIAIVDVNSGVIENVYMKVNVIETIQNDYQKGGAITRENAGGTIRNCVVNITIKEGVVVGKDSNGSSYSAVAAIAWYNQNGGVIERCYASVDNSDIPLVSYNVDGTVADSGVFATERELTDAIKFDTALGWSGYFRIVNGEIVFG